MVDNDDFATTKALLAMPPLTTGWVRATIELTAADGNTVRMDIADIRELDTTNHLLELPPVDGWECSEPSGLVTLTITGMRLRG